MFRILTLATFIAFNVISAHAADLQKATLYKNPQCGCCETYADYLRDNNFDVNVIATHDLPLIKDEHNVPKKFEGCHTMIVNDYVVEGHVPIATLNKLLTEKPNIKGISLPGMPMGSPGMTGAKTGPFTIYEIDENATTVYAVE